MKYFDIGYERNSVSQSIIVKAESAKQAERFFKAHEPDAVFYGIYEKTNIDEDIRKGKPIITAE